MRQKAVHSFYKFCPRCGRSTKKSRENLVVCESHHRIYINPRPTNAVIFENEKGQLLLVRRKFEPYKNMWDLPGGFVDLGENVEESALREVKEELGVEVDHLKYVGSVNDFYEYDGAIHSTTCMSFAAKISPDQSIKVTDDVSGYDFFAKVNVPFEEIGFASIAKVIKRYVYGQNL